MFVSLKWWCLTSDDAFKWNQKGNVSWLVIFHFCIYKMGAASEHLNLLKQVCHANEWIVIIKLYLGNNSDKLYSILVILLWK